MRAAQINDTGVVINYAEVTGFDGIRFLDPMDSQLGSTWDGSKYLPPSPTQTVVPQSVTMRQARLALFEAGKLGAVQAAIDAMPEPDRTKANIEWGSAAVVERGSDFTLAMGAAIGLTPAQIDHLFVQASQL